MKRAPSPARQTGVPALQMEDGSKVGQQEHRQPQTQLRPLVHTPSLFPEQDANPLTRVICPRAPLVSSH